MSIGLIYLEKVRREKEDQKNEDPWDLRNTNIITSSGVIILGMSGFKAISVSET
jgi:hypothetical protein